MKRPFLMPGLLSLLVVTVAIGTVTHGGERIARPMLSELRHAPVQVLHRSDGRVARGLRNEAESKNWSGYVVAKFESGEAYTSAQGTWTVPAVTYFAGYRAEYSASWVGIGGFCKNLNCTATDHTLIQLGTEQDVSSSGLTDYYAWYELLPRPPKLIPLAVNSGDIITASLQCVAHCSAARQSWTLTMNDQTTQASWTNTFTYASKELSVEWIEEAPALAGRILPLADYDTLVFDPNTANGSSPNLSISANGIVMADPRKQTSNPSDADSDLDGFDTCWGEGTTLTPCSAPSS